jgi:hypothetical protein
MASAANVKKYLAYWLQLGQGMRLPQRSTVVKPRSILADGQYSPEFEALWQQLQNPQIAVDSYLEGTTQTIAQILSPEWEIHSCPRCELPVPIRVQGLPAEGCPCCDIPHLPNFETILPREPVKSQDVLAHICDRLQEER